MPQWYSIAQSYLGVKEVPGKGSNPIILAWAARLGGWIKSFFVDDDIAWCALFLGICLAESGRKGSGSLAALSYASWGKASTAALGAILVFTRNGGGHVGFYAGEREDAYYVLGGNQSNEVSYAWVSRSRLRAIRWPEFDPLPTTGRVWLSNDGKPVSTNEG